MRAARGFTLIELLVVLVIIGTLVSLTVLSAGSSSHSRELRDEAERLAGLITLLSDEAVLDGQEYGLLVDAEGYGVLIYDHASGDWNEMEDRQLYKLPVWSRLLLELDGEALQLPEPSVAEDLPGLGGDDEEDKEKPIPQLLILSSGELSPFRLRLEERKSGGGAYLLSSDGYQLPRAELAGQSL
ncbi:type II secretion system minor pseudopilin GspH [Pseudomonas sp. SO81]|uniref:type II secretion system minor pseudopilin GspH n=1 Tax=Pseudomonas sp. SO81 TaxID=2983246 RepID=UPI0025A4AB6A|nr:type II secretion system minor pseudopilin GspH [Pseudomonas sp. SO81]WJN59420.1 type II secretion system protein H [Pseudomonas sp. SO81]